MAEQNTGYPMISEKNWWTIREKFKASLPSTVTANYIKTLLTMSNDNSANSNVINPLKRMGIIDDDNKPTSLANDWRLDDKYKSTCDVIVKTVYSSELLDLFPNSDVDRNTARSWFMSQGVGQAAADKMAALFILLKSGEIKDQKSKATKKSKISQKNNIKQKKDTSFANNDTSSINVDTKNVVDSVNRPAIHIDLQIHISPDFSLEQIDAIFASMSKHLYGMDK